MYFLSDSSSNLIIKDLVTKFEGSIQVCDLLSEKILDIDREIAFFNDINGETYI